MSASARGWGSAAIVEVTRRTPSGTALTADAHRTGARQIHQNGSVRKRTSKLFYVALVLVAALMLLVGTASATFGFTPFAKYGDANRSYNDTYNVIMWYTGTHNWVATGNVTTDTDIGYVVVGGGGGGGYALGGGGGGAGAYWEGTINGGITGPSNIVVVGAGGAGKTGAVGTGSSGGDSILFSTITATGGSGGGGPNSTSLVLKGGSAGGGGSPLQAEGIQYGASNISNQPGYGNSGGLGRYSTCRVPQLMSVLLTEFMSAFDKFTVLVEIDFVVID